MTALAIMDAAHMTGTRALARRWPDTATISVLANAGDPEAQALVGWVRRRLDATGNSMAGCDERDASAAMIAADLEIGLEFSMGLCNLANWSS